MRHLKKIALFLFLGLASLGGSLFALDGMMKKQGGLGHLSTSIEAMRLRRAHPGMPPDEIQRHAEKANHGVLGVLETLRGVAAGKPPVIDNSSAPSRSDDRNHYIRVAENKEAWLKAQIKNSSTEKTTAPHDHGANGVVQEVAHQMDPNKKTVQLRNTNDGREVIAILNSTGGEDLAAVERIKQLNIPDDMKNRILKNYYATGIMPEILVKEKRGPSVESKSPVDPDDPYSPKNY